MCYDERLAVPGLVAAHSLLRHWPAGRPVRLLVTYVGRPGGGLGERLAAAARSACPAAEVQFLDLGENCLRGLRGIGHLSAAA